MAIAGTKNTRSYLQPSKYSNCCWSMPACLWITSFKYSGIFSEQLKVRFPHQLPVRIRRLSPEQCLLRVSTRRENEGGGALYCSGFPRLVPLQQNNSEHVSQVTPDCRTTTLCILAKLKTTMPHAVSTNLSENYS